MADQESVDDIISQMCQNQEVDFSTIDIVSQSFDAHIRLEPPDEPVVPEDRVISDVNFPLYEGFHKKIVEPFSQISKNMKPMEINPLIMKEVVRVGTGGLFDENVKGSMQYQFFVESKPEPYDSTFFEDRGPRSISLDEGLFPGLHDAVRSMRSKEIARFLVPPFLGFGRLGMPPLIPPNAQIYMEIEVFDFVNKSKRYNAEEDEKVDCVLHLLNKGNDAYRNNETMKCLHWYIRGLSFIDLHIDSENHEKFRGLFLRLHTNLALVYNKVGQPEEAIKHCKMALEEEPRHMKAIFHLGRGFMLSGDRNMALETLLKGSKMFPNSECFHSELVKLTDQGGLFH